MMLRCESVVRSYNKTEDDFNTTDEYNDYLETLENLSTPSHSLEFSICGPMCMSNGIMIALCSF